MTRRTVAGCVPQAVVAMDFAVLAVAAPRLQASLAVSDAALAWLFSAYNLVFGVLLLPAGRAADRLGARPVLVAGLGLFAAAELCVAAAPSFGLVLAARVLQGVGAAAMTPAALAVLSAGRRGAADYGLSICVGFVSGALVAGLLVPRLGWRSCTAVLAAVALAGLAAAVGVRSPPARARPRRISIPLAGCAAGLAVTGTGVAATLLLTRHLQDDRGLSPLEAALALAAFGLTAPLAGRLAARITATSGRARLALWGPGAQGVALAALAAAFDAPLAALLAAVAAFGCGHVLGNAAAAQLALGGRGDAGTSAAALATAQYVGGALGPLLLTRPAVPAAAALTAAALIAAASLARPRHAAAPASRLR